MVRFLEVGVVAIDGHVPRLLKGPCSFPHTYCGETGLSLVASLSFLSGDGLNAQRKR